MASRSQSYYGKPKGGHHWKNQKNHALFRNIQLPEKIKCTVCEIAKPANDDNYSLNALFKAKKGISEKGASYRELLTKGGANENYFCSLCSDRSRAEMQCTSCYLWLDLDSFSKMQRKDPDNADCRKCVAERLAAPTLDEMLEEEHRQQKEQKLVETDSLFGDDDEDAQSVASDTATVNSSIGGVTLSTTGRKVSIASTMVSETNSESGWSAQTPYNVGSSVEDDFIPVGPYKGNKWDPRKYRNATTKNSGFSNGWKNSNNRSHQNNVQQGNNWNRGNTGQSGNGWKSRNNSGLGATAWHTESRPNGPKSSKRPSPWVKNSELKAMKRNAWKETVVPNLMDDAASDGDYAHIGLSGSTNVDTHWTNSSAGNNAGWNFWRALEIDDDLDSRW